MHLKTTLVDLVLTFFVVHLLVTLVVVHGLPQQTHEPVGGGSIVPTAGPKLIQAASIGSIEKVKGLLGKGIPVNVRGRTESTALIAAAANGHVKVVQLLLK